ncbi:MAG: hypothetical protein PUE22_01740 [Roseburia porci]|nr:hypothetical protein [Roseburia porci]
MEKNILRQYDSIKKEIGETNRRIQSAKDKLRRIEESESVVDSVSGGYGGTQHFKVEGFPCREYSKQKNILIARTAQLEELQLQLINTQAAVETYIYSIPDSECRRIASFRYIDNLSWRRTAEQMGPGYTEDACRKALDRYIQKN